MKKITLIALLFSLNLYSQTIDLFIGSNADFHTKGTVSIHGNTTIANGQKFSGDVTSKVLVRGNVTITTNPVVNSGAFTFTNTSEKNISGNIQSKAIYMTSNSALNLNGTGNLKATDSLTLNGVVKTNANNVELGSSPTNVGTLVHTSGYIDGTMRRWFGAANVTDVLFPLGASTYFAPVKISYSTAPSVGGTLTGKHMLNTANPLIVTSLVDGSTTVDKVSEMNIWQFDAENGLTGGDYNMEVNTNLIYGVVDVNELRIVKRATSSDPWTLNGTHVSGAGTTSSPIVKRSAMNGFSQFAIGSSAANPLPVTLTYLNADCSDNGVVVKWQTASEYNSEYYSVEKSLDGQNWNEIVVKVAAGNSTSVIDYSIVDSDRISGIRYYRLNQVDKNGESVIYGPVSASCSFSESAVAIFPNPATAQFNLAITSENKSEVVVEVISTDGKIVATLTSTIDSGSTIIPVNVEGNVSGVYHVFATINGKTMTEKLVIL